MVVRRRLADRGQHRLSRDPPSPAASPSSSSPPSKEPEQLLAGRLDVVFARRLLGTSHGRSKSSMRLIILYNVVSIINQGLLRFAQETASSEGEPSCQACHDVAQTAPPVSRGPPRS